MTILAVDDEKLELASLEEQIRILLPDAQVLAFRKPSEALEAVKEQPCDIAFLDIEMKEMDGITLAKRIKRLHPDTNIIFTTGYSEYSGEAFAIHASGYLMKPIFADMIQEELDNLRHPIDRKATKRLQAKTFGNFEVFVDGAPMSFHYNKTKELLAYLIDREGAVCTNRELMSVLWESDEPHLSYIQKIRKDLQTALEEAGKLHAINAYRGEYMSQYSWAEVTHGSLEYASRKKKETKE